MRGSGGLGTSVGLGGGVRGGVTHEEGPRVQGEGGESGEEMEDGGDWDGYAVVFREVVQVQYPST